MELICWIPAILAKNLIWTQFGRFGNSLLQVFIAGQIGSDKNHLPAQVPGQPLGFMTLFFVDIQPDGHEVVGGGGDGRGPTDAPAGPGYQTDMTDMEIGIGQRQDIFFSDFRFFDGHRLSLMDS